MAEEKAIVNEEELNELLAKSKKLQEKEIAGEGAKVNYLLLAKIGSKALKKSNELYIEGLKSGDFYLQKQKLNLGDKLEVVPLSFITIYNEKESDSMDAQFFGVWNKEQALTYPLVEGSYFNRQLPNGHILAPVNWVIVEIVGHPEIENAVIAYKSTGSRIWREWKTDAKNRASTSATLVYEIHEETYNNDKHDWTNIGYCYKRDLLETDKALAVTCLKKSNAVRESYENKLFIADHTIEAPAKVAAIEVKVADEDTLVF